MWSLEAKVNAQSWSPHVHHCVVVIVGLALSVVVAIGFGLSFETPAEHMLTNEWGLGACVYLGRDVVARSLWSESSLGHTLGHSHLARLQRGL